MPFKITMMALNKDILVKTTFKSTRNTKIPLQ